MQKYPNKIEIDLSRWDDLKIVQSYNQNHNFNNFARNTSLIKKLKDDSILLINILMDYLHSLDIIKFCEGLPTVIYMSIDRHNCLENPVWWICDRIFPWLILVCKKCVWFYFGNIKNNVSKHLHSTSPLHYTKIVSQSCSNI